MNNMVPWRRANHPKMETVLKEGVEKKGGRQ
jgi:hypothetical protein